MFNRHRFGRNNSTAHSTANDDPKRNAICPAHTIEIDLVALNWHSCDCIFTIPLAVIRYTVNAAAERCALLNCLVRNAYPDGLWWNKPPPLSHINEQIKKFWNICFWNAKGLRWDFGVTSITNFKMDLIWFSRASIFPQHHITEITRTGRIQYSEHYY